MDDMTSLELRRIGNALDNIDAQLQMLNMSINTIVGDYPGCEEHNVDRLMELADKVSILASVKVDQIEE
jgi:hypothetical protein